MSEEKDDKSKQQADEKPAAAKAKASKNNKIPLRTFLQTVGELYRYGFETWLKTSSEGKKHKLHERRTIDEWAEIFKKFKGAKV